MTLNAVLWHFQSRSRAQELGGDDSNSSRQFLSLHVCVKIPCLLGHWEFKCIFTAINSALGIDHPQGFTTAVSSHHTQCISYEYFLRHSLATYLLAESLNSFLVLTFVQSPPHFKLNFKSFKFNLVNYLFKGKNLIFSYIFTPAIGSHNFLGVCKLFIRAWYFWDHIIMRPILQMHKTNSSAEEQCLQYMNIIFS